MITKSEMEQVLRKARSTGGDFSELFFEDRQDTILKNVNQRVNGVTSLHICGAGLYLMKGLNSVYVYSSDTSFRALMDLAETAAGLLPFAEKNQETGHITFSLQKNGCPNPVRIWPDTISAGEKVRIVKEMDLAARSAGPVVRALNVEYFDNVQHVTIANSEGLYTEDTRTFTRIRMAGTVAWKEKACFEFHDLVKPQGFELFQENDYVGFAQNAIRDMEDSMKLMPVPAAVAPVIFEAGPCGVFWHEACGHNLESTASQHGCFSGKLGEKIASEKVTLIDDGTIPGMCGSEAIDDEGHPTRKNVLIKDGVMTGWLCDRKGGRMLGCGSTGSGRRQSYTFAPAARMHNTYLAPGEDDEEEMIRSVENGLLVTELGGGSSGNHFSVVARKGFWIRDGRLAEPVGGIALSGVSTEIIKRIDRVGKHLVPDLGGGFCGAASGLVQTTAYEPRFRVSQMNIGGVQG